MDNEITIRVAETAWDLNGILQLQSANLPSHISMEEKATEGFVTVHHDLVTLEKMASLAPQFIAVHNDKTIGYTLSMVPELRSSIAVLKPMFTEFDKLEYGGRKLSKWKYIVSGQACVDKAYRGQGLIGNIYAKMQQLLCPSFDICITEIATTNHRSLKAHSKRGFETLHTYNDGLEDWEVVVWDWGQSNRAESEIASLRS